MIRDLTIEIKGTYTIELDGDLEEYTDEELAQWAKDYYSNSNLDEFDFEIQKIKTNFEKDLTL